MAATPPWPPPVATRADPGHRRHKKSAERNTSVFMPRVATYSSGHALPVANRVPSLGFDSATKEWDNIHQHKVQSINFLSSLERPSENSVIAGKMAGGKLNNHSVEPTKRNHLFSLIELVLQKRPKTQNLAVCNFHQNLTCL
ncbi:hypothetical protein SETIT_6G151900v2 [Setaria italica]|uniref:Uncharacterized protein n=1 Tax=Setaria italica TaxID=4555 RepID=K3YK44_SETIT|nr:hypothetical protein SETIT_6G151900v2 [Setaria italica]